MQSRFNMANKRIARNRLSTYRNIVLAGRKIIFCFLFQFLGKTAFCFWFVKQTQKATRRSKIMVIIKNDYELKLDLKIRSVYSGSWRTSWRHRLYICKYRTLVLFERIIWLHVVQNTFTDFKIKFIVRSGIDIYGPDSQRYCLKNSTVRFYRLNKY